MAVSLNDQQAIAILTEGLNRNLYANNGGVPQDEKVRLKDATDLVNAAQLASNNGNKSDNVETILFIALSDTKPPIAQNPPVQSPAEIAPKEDSPIQGFDITQVSDGVLEGLIIGLDKFPNNENVENERKAYIAEKERRGNASQPAGQAVAQEPQTEAAQEANTNPSGGPGSGSEGQIQIEDGAQGEPPTEDAGAFARAQTPETSKEEKVPKAKAVEEDGERAGIEAQLTLPMVKAHGIDLTKILDIPTEQLKFIVDNPEGAPEKEIQMPVNEQEVEASAIANPNINTVGGISGNVEVPVQAVSKADLGLGDVEEESSPGEISADRERMEAVLTGPILKSYGRGRKQVPSIGDNELQFMIMNPTGKVTPEELEAAKALDNPNQMIVTKEISGPPIEDSFIKTPQAKYPPGENPLTEVTLPSGKIIKIATEIVAQEVATKVESSIENKPVQVEEQPDRTVIEAAKEAIAKNPIVASPEQIKDVESLENKVSIDTSNSPGQNRAMDIIAKENFPIPKDFDGEPPAFPNDISKVTDDELFSFHAIYYACESRANWILSQYEDELLDIEKLRMYREAIVANSVPFLGEDGRRNTNEFRDARVNADNEVLELGKKENEINKIVKKLKVLRDNYRTSVSVCSRQYSMRSGELKDIPK